MLLLLLSCSSAPQDHRPAAKELDDTVCVNEFMPANKASRVHQDGSSPDWIELHNPGDVEVDLTGWTITDNPDKPEKHALDGLSIPSGGHLLLFATGTPEQGVRHLGFKLGDEESVGLFDPSGDGTLVHYGVVHEDFSVARSSDCCTGDGCLEHAFQGSPGYSNTASAPAMETLLGSRSTWFYLDQGNTPSWNWLESDFNNERWGSAQAPLGYGEGDITSPVDGPAYPAVFFRQTFTLTRTDDIDRLQLELMADDGARVWLNGEQILAINVAEDVDHESFAAADVPDLVGEYLFTHRLDPALLVEGENVLAIAIHKADGSEELAFDASVKVMRLD